MRRRSTRGGWTTEPRDGLVVPGRELRSASDWPVIFGRTAPLVVEIGFGKDTFLLERAAACPQDDHIGVERDPHRVERFLARATERGLTNVRALPVSGEMALAICLPPRSVAALHVYFPDPWPKERHAYHRLVRPWFAGDVLRTLTDDGVAYLATDDAPYFEQMCDVLAVGGLSTERVHGAAELPGHETRFEQLWRSKGRNIQRLVVRRAAVAKAAPVV